MLPSRIYNRLMILSVLLAMAHTCVGRESSSAPAQAESAQTQSVLPEQNHGVRYTSDFAWRVPFTEDLSAPGAKTITLPACPAGVQGDQPEYWVYISGKGEAEAVKVQGGTCKGDGGPGTLTFATTRPHPAGDSIGSASDGLQEASIASTFRPSNPTGLVQSGRVMVSPGTELKLHARVSIRAAYQVVDFSGSVFECYMTDTCIFIGDPKNAGQSFDVTLVNPRGRPMVPGNTKPMIETNAQNTRIINISARVPGNNGTFGTYVQVDNDQAFLLDGLDSSNRGVRCDSDFCGAYVIAPGPFSVWAAVGWLKNLNISPQCHGNGVDWQSGNTLRISDSVIQGFQQFGVRTGVRRGGYGGTELDNVYMEVGACGRQMGAAGVIANGGPLTIRSDRNPQGQSPQFQNLGSTYYHYFVVASHPTLGDSMPLAAGWAKTDRKTPVNVIWPVIRGVQSGGRYKLLRIVWDEKSDKPAPMGSGNWLIASIDPSSCEQLRCTFKDTHGEGTSYTTVNMLGGSPPYYPSVDFWPGTIVLGGTDGANIGSPARLFIDIAPRDGIVSVARYTDGPTIYASGCQGLPGFGYGPTLYPAMVCMDSGWSSWPLKRGLLFQSKNVNDAGK